jgi:hypothetical protein
VVWFALNGDRPLFAFAGIWTEFRGDRGAKSKPIPGPLMRKTQPYARRPPIRRTKNFAETRFTWASLNIDSPLPAKYESVGCRLINLPLLLERWLLDRRVRAGRFPAEAGS